MAVGGYRTKTRATKLEQQTVEIIPDILIRHGELRPFDQFLHISLSDRSFDLPFDGFGVREVVRRKCVQCEPATAGPQLRAILFCRERHGNIFRQHPADVQQFPRWHGRTSIVPALGRNLDDQFDFHVGGGQRESIAHEGDEQVTEDRQPLFALYDTLYDLQAVQQRRPIQCEVHLFILVWLLW